MRQFISVDTAVSVAATSGLQVVSQSQAFQLTKSRRRFLFASGQIGDPDNKLLWQNSVPVRLFPVAPFLAVVFLDPSGAALDTVWLGAQAFPISTNPNWPSQVLDCGGAGAKWAMNPTEEFFLAGAGGYPPGTASIALLAGVSVYNPDAAPHNAIVRLRGIMEEIAE